MKRFTCVLVFQRPTQVLASKVSKKYWVIAYWAILLSISLLTLSANLQAQTLDSDGDGIVDSIDLDDDNDGILDAFESASCFYTSTEAIKISAVTSEIAPFEGGDTPSMAIDGNSATDYTFALSTNWVGKELYRMTPLVQPLSISGLTLNIGTYNMSNGAASTFKLQGSLDGVTWVDLSAAVSNTTANTTFTVSNTLQPTSAYNYFRLVGVAGTSYAASVKEITLNIPTSYQASEHPKSVCSADADGDGILNHLDLDSDGDGCPDAIEGGANFTNANLVTSTMAGGSTNITTNLGNTVGNTATTMGVPTIAGTGQAIGTSLFSTQNACLDSDNDGIVDVDDLDDDNDGILDTLEGVCSDSGVTLEFGGTFGTSNGVRDLTTPASAPYSYTWLDPFPNGDGKYAVFAKNYSATWFPYGNNFRFFSGHTTGTTDDAFLAVNGSSSPGIFFTENIKITLAGAYDFGLWAINAAPTGSGGGLPNIEINIKNSSGTVVATINSGNIPDDQTWKQLSSSVTLTPGVYTMEVKSISTALSGNDFAIDDIFFKRHDGTPMFCVDTDGDGIQDSLDLDSDGDGCPDAIEGEVAFVTTNLVSSTMAGGNSGAGYNGTSTTPITTNLGNNVSTATATNGVPVLAGSGQTIGYSQNTAINGCIDSDSDGYADIDDLDDDNDGILDVSESTCNIAQAAKTGVVVSSELNFSFTNGNNTLNSLIDASAADAAYSPSGTFANSTWFKIAFPSRKVLTLIELSHQAGASLFNTTSTYKIQGSNDNSAWIDIVVSQTYTNTTPIYAATNSAKFDMPANTTAYQYYRIVGISSPGSAGGMAGEFYFRESVCVSPDTDNDGIVNSLDLDSDGDGCADAIEGGANFTTANLVTSTMAGGNSGTSYNGTSTSPVNQNLGNTVGNTTTTMGVPTIAGTGQTIGTSQNATVQDANCPQPDYDGDGVADANDLDDDNDGILDADECEAALPYKVYTFNVSSATYASNLPTTITGKSVLNTTINQTTTVTSNPSFPNWKEVAANVYPDANNKITVTITASSSITGTTVIADGMMITNGVNTYYLDNSSATGFTTTGTWLSFSSATTYLGSHNYIQSPFTGATATWTFSNLSSITLCDNDNDGIPNHLDLDSDGDGCADAIEGGATFTTANLQNSTMAGGNSGAGYIGTSSTPVTQNLGNTVGNTATTQGVPTIAGTGQTVNYSQDGGVNECIDSDNDGVNDLTDLDDDNDGILDVAECSAPAQKILIVTGAEDYGGIKTNFVAEYTNNAPVGSVITTRQTLDDGVAPVASFYDGYDLVVFYGNAAVNVDASEFAALQTAIINKTSKAFVVHVDFCCNATNRTALVNLLNTVYGTNYSVGSTYYNTHTGVATINSANPYATSLSSISSLNQGVYYPILGVAANDILYFALNNSNQYSTTEAIAGMKLLPGTTDKSRYLAWFADGTMFQGAPSIYPSNQNKIAPAFYNAYQVNNSSCDTDGDGIINQLDLDSDGDGCSDAIEGGATFTTANLQNSTMAGGNSGVGYIGNSTTPVTQNLGNTVGNTATTMGVPTIAGTGQTVNYSQDGGVNECIDSDNDGVNDLADLDDDNDGILDAVECSTTNLVTNGTFASNLSSWSAGTGWTWSSGLGGSAVNMSDNISNSSLSQSISNLPTGEVSVKLKLIAGDFGSAAGGSATLDILLNGTMYARITNGTLRNTSNVTMVLFDGATSDFVPFGTAPGGGVSTFTLNIPYTGPSTATLAFRMSAPASGDDWRIDDVSVLKANECDTDGDGIPNSLDLDSDGDGCSDAIEGGATNITAANLVTSTMPGGNSGAGYTGTSTTPVTQNLGNTVGNTATTMGVPTIVGTGRTIGYSQIGSVNACTDSDNDGIADIDDLDDDNDGILDKDELCQGAIGDGNMTLRRWDIAGSEVISTSSWYNQNPGTHLNTGGVNQSVTGELPLGSGAPTQTTIINNFTNLSTTTGDFYIAEGYISFPSSATSVSLRVAGDNEMFVSLYLPEANGIMTNNKQDYKKVAELKRNFGGTAVYRIDYTTLPSNAIGGVWPFAIAVSDGDNTCEIHLQWSINGGAFVTVPTQNIFSSLPSCRDIDGDGIANTLDLDSDGDGCPDAIEGGAAFTTANLQNSTMAGGNSGAGYTGTSTTAVTQNLGNTVGNTATTMGVPTIAGTGQTVGTSQNKLTQDPNCPICPTITNIAGDNANPSSCGTATGSIKICGLPANSTGWTVNYDKNGTPATALTNQTADASGCITITGLTAGSYTNIKVSSTSCPAGSNALSATLADPAAPSAPTGLAGVPSSVCIGTSVALSATGAAGATYAWTVSPAGATLSSVAGTVSGTTASNTFNSTASGTYTVSVTQTVAGCTSTPATTTITVNATPTTPVPTATSKANVCPATTVDLTTLQPAAVSGVTYEWHTVASNPTAGTLVATPSAVAAGTYYLYAKSSTGCYSAASSLVTATVTTCCPTITNSASGNVNPTPCAAATGSIKICGLIPNGTGYTVNYDKNGTPATALTNQTADASGCITITGLTAGSYTNIKVSSTACSSGSNALSASLSDPTAPTAPTALSGQPSSVCIGASVALSATGTAGATYNWSVSPTGATLSSASGTVSGTTASNTLTSTSAGTYTVSVSQTLAGCTSVGATTTITVNARPSTPVPTATSKSNVCPATTVDLTSLQPAPVSGVTYEWHTVASNPTAATLVSNPTTAASGTYYLYGKSTSGCYSAATSAITATVNSCTPCTPVDPGIATASAASIKTGNTASFTLTGASSGTTTTWVIFPSNGVSPNTGTGTSTGTVTFNVAGEYQVLFTTTNSTLPAGCVQPNSATASVRFLVESPINPCAKPSASTATVSPSSAAIATGATASFTMTGGVPNSSVQWVIVPSSGVSPSSGSGSSTGSITFANQGLYTAIFSITNIGDGTCAPVQQTSSAPIAVGLNPCSPPTSILINSSVANQTSNVGQAVTFTATGGIPGVMTWTVTPSSGASPSSGTGNVATVTFSGTGTYTVAFTSKNSSIPLGCTQPVNSSSSAMHRVVATYPPVVVVPPIVTEPGKPATVCGDINDPDLGDTHTVTVCGAPSKGSIGTPTVNNTTHKVCLTYTPTAGQTGSDQACLLVCDQTGKCDTVTVPIIITPVLPPSVTPKPPVVIVTPIITQQDSTSKTCMPILDQNGTSTTNTFTICGAPKNGTANPVTSTGGQLCITYKPNAGFTGRDSVCVIVCDGANLCDTVNVPITVYPKVVPGTQQPPVVVLPPIVTEPGKPVTICGSVNDPNAGDTHTVTLCNAPTKGNVSGLSVNNTTHQLCMTYTPKPGQTGNDKVCVTVCDQTGKCTTVEVPVTIVPGNEKPIATDDIAVTPSGKPVSGNVLTNDKDPEGGSLTVSTTPTTLPSKGQVQLNADGTYTYTPNPGATGTDTFCYQVCDASGACDTACVTVNILPSVTPDPNLNDKPIANDDNTQTYANTPLTVVVKANDLDPDGNNTLGTPSGVTPPANGNVVYNSDGTVTYTPKPGFVGKDSFTYKICDNGTPSLCDTARVTVEVLPTAPAGNKAPVAIDDANLTPKNTPVSGTVASNDSDPDAGQTLSFSAIGSVPGLTLNPNGTYSYTPTAGFVGTVSQKYKVCDSGSPTLCDTATLMIAVTDPLNQKPIATDDIAVTPNDKPVSGNVLTNDIDPDGNPLTVSTTPTTLPSKGQVQLNADGTYTYTPNPGATGMDTFCYKVCDNQSPAQCDTACVTVNIVPTPGPTNDKPVANDDNTQTYANTPLTVVVKANDLDPDGNNTLGTPSGVTPPAHGNVVYNSDGTVTYTPATGFVGKDSFTYKICDNGTPSLCDTATVNVEVLPIPPSGNKPPVVIDDANFTTLNTSVNGNVSLNDKDPDAGQTLIFSKLSNPANGSVLVNPDGTYTYTPANGYLGSDFFTYKVCDSGSPQLCDVGTVILMVFPSDKVCLLPKAYLQGALFGVTLPDTLMRDDLRVKGLLPTTSPYVGMGMSGITSANTTTLSVVGSSSPSGGNAIVDWVFLELRSGSDSTLVVDSRSALIQRDGDIVEVDGVNPVKFSQAGAGNYYVVVRHRNHLGVMSKKVSLSGNCSVIDFRKASTPTFTLNSSTINQAQVVVEQGRALWAGNALFTNTLDNRHEVVFQGSDNDVNVIYQQVINATGNVFVSPFYKLKGYYSGDINLNGEVIFQGTTNDVEFIYQNIIKNHPGNTLVQPFFKIKEQMP